MREILRNGLTAAVIGTTVALGAKTVEKHTSYAAENFNKQTIEQFEKQQTIPTKKDDVKDDLEKLGWTFVGAFWVGAVTALGYRMADGADPVEKEVWLFILPTANFVGTSLLVATKWI